MVLTRWPLSILFMFSTCERVALGTPTVTFVQQPQPAADGLFAPVLKVEAPNPRDLDGASLLLQVGAGSPVAAGLVGPAQAPIDERGYANYSAGWRSLGVRGGAPGSYTLSALLLDRNDLPGRPALFQKINAQGVKGMVAFTVDGRHFVGVANHNDGTTRKIKSDIYVLNAGQTKFELFQQIDTQGAHGMAAINAGGKTYLGVANHFDGSTYKLKSEIYTLNAAQTKFELLQQIDTNGAFGMVMFVVGGRLFLTIANFRDDSTSDIYVLNAAQTKFELFQQVGTHGYTTGVAAFTAAGCTYIGFANYFDKSLKFKRTSDIYMLNTAQTKFELLQQINTQGALSITAFVVGGRNFLGFANNYDGSTRNIESDIYVLNAAQKKFELFQQIDTVGANGMAAIAAGGRQFLGVSNYRDARTHEIKSDIYVLNAAQTKFERVYQINTQGASSMVTFDTGNCTFLIFGNYRLDNSTRKLTCDVYSLAPIVATSTPFSLNAAGRPARLESYWMPASETVSNVPLAPAMTASVVDHLGNTVPCAGEIAAVELQTMTGAGQLCLRQNDTALCDTLSRNTATAPLSAAGTATFADLAISTHGEHTLGARAIVANMSGTCATGLEPQLLMEQFQRIDTDGALSVAAFGTGGRTFVAIANSHYGSTYSATSDIFVLNTAQTEFELFQQIDTKASSSISAFGAGGRSFLGFANFNGSSTYDMKSDIYVLNAAQTKFELFQQIDTKGALAIEAFMAGGLTFLGIANHRNGSTYKLKSDIYVLNTAQTKFELFQQVDTQGATAMQPFMAGGRTYLGVANYNDDSTHKIKSDIYVLNAARTQFQLFQQIVTRGARAIAAFTAGDRSYLSFANEFDGSTYKLKSDIYVLNAAQTKFELFQQIDTEGANEMTVFMVGGRTFLGIANKFDGSTYKLTSDIYALDVAQTQFELVQQIDTQGGSSMVTFGVDNRTFVVVANYGDDRTRKVHSDIYEVRLGTAHLATLVRANVRCSACPVGYTCPSAQQTEPCPAGSACVAGVRQPCPAGKHQPSRRQSTCLECASGQYGGSAGATHCEDCPAGTFRATVGASSTRDCTPCPSGKHAPQPSAQACDDCPVNTFSLLDPAARNISQCEPCRGGTYSDGGAPKCKLCERGRFRNTSMSGGCVECGAGEKPVTNGTACAPYCRLGHFCQSGIELPCAVGRFQNVRGAAECKPCRTGQYQDEPNATNCKPCAACTNGLNRSLCEGASAGVCPVCSPGTFADASTLRCEPCSKGTYQNESDASSCRPCEPCSNGRRQKCGGASEGFCTPCIPGTFVDHNSTPPSCAPCAAGTFSNVSDAFTCTECPTGKFQDLIGQPFCETCGEGFVCDRASAAIAGPVQRRVCPAGSECTAQKATPCALGKVSNNVGKCETCRERFYAHKRNNTCALCPTIPAVACVGDGVARMTGSNWYCERCVGRAVDLEHIIKTSDIVKCRHDDACNTTIDVMARVTTHCAKSRRGALCDACADGYGAAGPVCRRCPPSGTIESILLLGALVFLGIFAQTVRLSLKHSLKPESSKRITTTSLKILVAFIFETALLASYQLDWGSALRTLFGIGSAAATGDVTSIALTSCLGIDLHLKMKFVFATPFLSLLLPLPAIGWAKWRSRSELCGATLRSAYSSIVLIALWLLHPALLGECVLALETLRVGEREYVAADLSVETSDPAYATTRSLALVLLFTFVPLFPCYVFGALYHYRKHLCSDEAVARAPVWMRQRLYYFYGSFKQEFFLWEVIGFVHKALLAVIAAKASVVLEPGVPLWIATWVVLSQFGIELRYQAYKREHEGRLIKITLFGLLALMLSAQGLAVATLAGDPGFQEVTRLVAGIVVVGIIAYCVVALCQGQQAVGVPAGNFKHNTGWKVFRTFSAANPMFRRASLDAQPPSAYKNEATQHEVKMNATAMAPKRDDRSLTFTDSTHGVAC